MVWGVALPVRATTSPSKMDAVWEFVKSHTSRASMMTIFDADISGQMPTRRSEATDSDYLRKQSAALTGFVELLPYSGFRPVLPDGDRLYDLYRHRLLDMIMSENITPDHAVAETARQVRTSRVNHTRRLSRCCRGRSGKGCTCQYGNRLAWAVMSCVNESGIRHQSPRSWWALV